MRRISYLLLVAVLQVVLCQSLSAQQQVNGSATVPLNATGENDGVQFINQTAVVEGALEASIGQALSGHNAINFNQHADGITTNFDGKGIVDFNGNTGSNFTTVFGNVGSTALRLDEFEIDSGVTGTVDFVKSGSNASTFHALHVVNNSDTAKFLFNIPATANDFTFGANGVIEFGAGSSGSAGSILFEGHNGTAILDSNITFNGSVTTTTNNTGILELNGGSKLNGNAGSIPESCSSPGIPLSGSLNTIRLPTGNAEISGNASAQTFDLGCNTLKVDGQVFFSNSSVLDVSVCGTTHGQIKASRQGNFALPATAGDTCASHTGDIVTVNMSIEPTTSNTFTCAPLQIVSAGANGCNTSISHPVCVTSNIPRVQFTGFNPENTADIFVTPFIEPAPLPSEVGSGAAAALDALALGCCSCEGIPTGDLAVIEAALNELSITGGLAAVGAAEAQFAPIVNGDILNTQFELMREFQNDWAMTLVRARAANVCYNPSSSDFFGWGGGCCAPSCGQRGWNGEGLWFQTFGNFSEQKRRHGVLGYDADQYGFMVNLQRPVCDTNFEIGLGGGYGYTKIHGKHDFTLGVPRNHAKVNTGEVTLYLGYNPGCWFLDTFYTGAWSRVEGHREVNFGTAEEFVIDRVAKSEYDVQEFGFYGQTGYNFCLDCLTMTPLFSLEYVHLHREGFRETNAGSGVNLVNRGQHYDNLQTGLGLMLGYPVDLCLGSLFLEAHGKWLYNAIDHRIRERSAFEGAPCLTFDTRGNRIARSEGNVGVSATLFTCSDWVLEAGYDYYGRDQFSEHEYLISAIYKF